TPGRDGGHPQTPAAPPKPSAQAAEPDEGRHARLPEEGRSSRLPEERPSRLPEERPSRLPEERSSRLPAPPARGVRTAPAIIARLAPRPGSTPDEVPDGFARKSDPDAGFRPSRVQADPSAVVVDDAMGRMTGADDINDADFGSMDRELS